MSPSPPPEPAPGSRSIATLAHDLANLLSSVAARISVLASSDLAPPVRTELETALADVARARETIREILQESRSEHRVSVEVLEVWRRLSKPLESSGATLRTDCREPSPRVLAVPAQLEQILTSVIEAECAAGGAHRITARIGGDGAKVRIEIESSAPPFSTEDREKLENPFFLRNPRALGGGLGFGICTRVAQVQGGDFRIDTSERGRRYRLELPAAAASATTPAPAAKATGRRCVLVVDDDRQVRDSYGLMLRHLGHEVHGAASGEEAVQRITAQEYDVIVLDLNLGGAVSGSDVVREIHQRRPKLVSRTILATGDPGGPAVLRLAADHGLGVLAKPFGLQELRQAIDSLPA